jgi:four helix bundle protein
VSFHYEDLRVYQKSLRFVGLIRDFSAKWGSGYAIKDHVRRAARSIPTNLAAGSVQRSSSAKTNRYDVALGSVYECAACLDVDEIYGLIGSKQVGEAKKTLVAMANMTVGLRKSAEVNRAEEDEAEYGKGNSEADSVLYHERLKVYQIGLEYVVWLHELVQKSEDVPGELFGELDSAGTSIVLNVAEGNGRFHPKDRDRFLGFAQDAAIKAATCLDIAVMEKEIDRETAIHAKSLLERITAMLFRMIGRDRYS